MPEGKILSELVDLATVCRYTVHSKKGFLHLDIQIRWRKLVHGANNKTFSKCCPLVIPQNVSAWTGVCVADFRCTVDLASHLKPKMLYISVFCGDPFAIKAMRIAILFRGIPALTFVVFFQLCFPLFLFKSVHKAQITSVALGKSIKIQWQDLQQ